MARIPVAALIAMVLFSGAVCAAAGPVMDARVTGVTVYTSGSAQVVREGKVSLLAGPAQLRSMPLPDAVDPRSVQVSFPGAGGGITIESVEVRRELPTDSDFQGRRAEYAKGLRTREDALFEIQQELKAVEDSIQSRNETLAFLEKMRQQTAQAADREMASAQFKADTWQAALNLVEQRAEKARQEIRQLTAQQRQIKFRLAEERLRYDEYSRSGPVQSHQNRLYVAVSVDAARTADYRVVYTVSKAWWEPSYRAAANLRDKTVVLDVYGSVRQQTGEDWEDVRLQLSSARPEIGTDVPVLLPWYIQTAPATGKAGFAEAEKTESTAEGGDSAPPVEPPAEPPPTEAVSTGTSTVFIARASARIPTDGQFHKIPITTLASPVTLQHVAIPKILPHAFLQAKMTNKAAFPLLPGVVEVMVGDSYMGRGLMKAAAPGEPVTLSLGVDETLRISIASADTWGEQRRKNGRVSTPNAFLIKAANFGDGDVDLTILDQLPISRSADVTVTHGPEAKKALRGATFPGQLKWEVRLGSRKSVDIAFDFTLEYPEYMKQALEQSNRDNALEYQYDALQQEEAAPAQPNAAPAMRYGNKVLKSKASGTKLQF